jgi:hypothetical protein
LDLQHQLLESNEPKPERKDETSTPQFSWGVPLAKDGKATSVSLLAEPRTSTNSTKQPRRAVVVVSSANADTCELDYATFQLQVTKLRSGNAEPAETYAEQKPYSVLVKASAHGTLRNGPRSVGPIASVFLAGASFRFNLERFGKTRQKVFRSFKHIRTHTLFLLRKVLKPRRSLLSP